MARKHRFERTESKVARKQGRKRSYDRILIVCEGEKTEVNYFQAIRKEKRLPTADIEIVPSDYGTAPQQIVDYAVDFFLKKNKIYDRIYVVFDRDDHATYFNALASAASKDNQLKNDNGAKVAFTAIPSVPNFELWLLLHFRDVLAPIHRTEVYAELRQAGRYPAYTKSSTTAYVDTKERMPDAAVRAAHLRDTFNAHDGSDPYTDADILTQTLLSLPNRFA